MADPPTRRARLGQDAENRVDRAARHRGWQCIARNFNSRGGELDLVYVHGEELIVVEVRYRSHHDYGGAVASVTRRKQRRIIHATRYFLTRYPKYAEFAVRFDVVGVDSNNELHWIEAAFDAV